MKSAPPKPRAPIVPPTVIAVADVADPGDALAGPTWLEYHVGGPAHWKQAGVWEIMCRVQTPTRPPEYRVYRIRAGKATTAVAGTIAAIASTVPTTVIVYEVRPPLRPADVGCIQEINLRWSRIKGPLLRAFRQEWAPWGRRRRAGRRHRARTKGAQTDA